MTVDDERERERFSIGEVTVRSFSERLAAVQFQTFLSASHSSACYRLLHLRQHAPGLLNTANCQPTRRRSSIYTYQNHRGYARLSIPENATVEFFAYGGTLGPISAISIPSPSNVAPTPTPDPVARLTRECSALRLRLATAERIERRSLCTDPGVRAPPSSARTPPSGPLPLPSPHDEHNAYRRQEPPSLNLVTTTNYARIDTFTVPGKRNAKPPSRPCNTRNTSFARKTLPRQRRILSPNPHSHNQPLDPTHLHINNPKKKTDAKVAAPPPTPISPTTTTTTMKPAEKCRQLEKTLREVQEVLRVRDREIDLLKKERDRLLADRDAERNLDREHERERERERNAERERERERTRERDMEYERERQRERERELERERERERVREREKELEAGREREQKISQLQQQLQQQQQQQSHQQQQQQPSQPPQQLQQRDRDRTPERPIRSHRDSFSTPSPPSARPTPNRQHSFRRSRSQAPLRKERDSYIHSLADDPLPPLHSPTYASHDLESLAHLRSLDVFLTKTDTWSGAQVIQAVEDLNAEITHFAASATESCVFVDRRTPPAPVPAPAPTTGRSGGGKRGKGRAAKNRESLAMANEGRQTPPRQGVVQSVGTGTGGGGAAAADVGESTPWLGPAFARILAGRDHGQDPMLVQLALQASVATCCARSLSLFCVGFPVKLDGLLSRVFGHMQVAEPQPTSSRWRALTHRSIRALYPGLEEYAVSELVTTMLRWSAAVFTLSGCSANPANPNTSANTDHDPKDKDNKDGNGVPATLKAQLRRIAEAVYNLARVTREEILSTAFEVVLVESGGGFEDGVMANAFGGQLQGQVHPSHGMTQQQKGANGVGGKAGGVNGNANGKTAGGDGKVLCTTELGLKCVTRKGRSSASAGEGADGDLFERRMLLPPKVVLDSAVEALDGA